MTFYLYTLKPPLESNHIGEKKKKKIPHRQLGHPRRVTNYATPPSVPHLNMSGEVTFKQGFLSLCKKGKGSHALAGA